MPDPRFHMKNAATTPTTAPMINIAMPSPAMEPANKQVSIITSIHANLSLYVHLVVDDQLFNYYMFGHKPSYV